MYIRRLLYAVLVLSIVLGCSTLEAGGGAAALPLDFLWGTALSAHSVEGNHTNDWSLWEMMPGKISDGSVSGAACNHWELFPEDHAWMKKLGQNSVIISLEWSRVQPYPGVFEPTAIAHYRKILESLHAHGIVPIVTLWDRTFPQWAAAYGGLENPLVIMNFASYAARMAKEYGDLVDFWVPLREPVRHALKAYKDGIYPPGRSDVVSFGKAVIMLMGMHRAAWQALKENDTAVGKMKNRCEVGLMLNFKYIKPFRPDNQMDLSLVKAAESLSSKSFADGIMRGDLIKDNQQGSMPGPKSMKGKGQSQQTLPPPNYDDRKADFIIAAYDGLEVLKFNILKPLMTEKIFPPGCWVDEAERIVYPAGLSMLATDLKKYPVPLYVMVSYAEAAGARRGAFIADHVRAVKDSISQGCRIAGFFYDSLLTGFEYSRGYSLKSGLLNVNLQIQERKPAGGSDVFRALALSNGESSVPRKMKRPRITK